MRIRKKWTIAFLAYVMVLSLFNYFAYLFVFSFDRVNAIVLVVLIGIFFTGAYNELFKKNAENNFVLCFFLLYFLQVVFSSLRYSQSFSNSFYADKFYFIIILYYVLVRCFLTRKDKDIIINTYIILALIICILIDVQVLLLHKHGIEILHLDYYKRAGGVRVTNSAHFIEIGILLTIAKSLQDWKAISSFRKAIYIAMTISGLINMFFVSRTRMSIIMVLAISGIVWLMKDIGISRPIVVRRIIILVIIFVSVVCIINTSAISVLFDDFGTNSVSIVLRMDEYSLYLGELFDSPLNFIFGLGMIHDTNTSFLYPILGVNGTGGRTDVGIVGFVNEFGLLGFMLYIWIIIRGYRLIKMARGLDINCLDLLVFYLYFVLGSGTLCMFNRGRIFAIPIMFFIYRFYSVENQKACERLESEE